MIAMNKYFFVLGAMMVAVGGCSSGGSSSELPSGNSPWSMSDAATYGYEGSGGSSAGPPLIIGGGGGSAGSAAPDLPPEQNHNLNFLAPQGGKQFVYVANPTRNTVTVINSQTLEINEVPTGNAPTFLATVLGQDIALVINVGSHTLSIVRGNSPPDMTNPLAIAPKANAIAIAPDGKHAVVWFDASLVDTTTQTPTALSGSTQEVSLVDLSGTTDNPPISITVGYNPSAVVFSSDGTAAFVVTEDGISQLRFADIKGPTIAPLTRIDRGAVTLVEPDAGAPDTTATPTADSGSPAYDGGAQFTEAGSARDATPPPSPPAPSPGGEPVGVSVTPDGHYAIARRTGGSELLLVDLKAGTVTPTDLSSEVTDLEMLPSGAQAFAVVRGESKLVRLDIPAGFTDTTHRATWPFSGGIIGSATISSSGKYALLYTTAVPVNSIVKFDLTTSETTSIPLHKAIRAVAIAPNESSALVLHTKTPGDPAASGISAQEQIDRSYGYTMVDLPSSATNQVLTLADPTPFVITPDSSYAFVLLRDDTTSMRIAQRISLASFATKDFLLGSPPDSIGALSAVTHEVFIGQVHPQGRISFIDWLSDSDNVTSVTGFVLNGGIQQ
jgi:hypothetical protein